MGDEVKSVSPAPEDNKPPPQLSDALKSSAIAQLLLRGTKSEIQEAFKRKKKSTSEATESSGNESPLSDGPSENAERNLPTPIYNDAYKEEDEDHIDMELDYGSSSQIIRSGNRKWITWKCRFCPFTTHMFSRLQDHMTRHSEFPRSSAPKRGMKALKCQTCDYNTNDKSNFRRHQRLHGGNNPVSVLKCNHCVYSTIMSSKFRTHMSVAHGQFPSKMSPYMLSPNASAKDPCSKQSDSDEHSEKSQHREGSPPVEAAPAVPSSEKKEYTPTGQSASGFLRNIVRNILLNRRKQNSMNSPPQNANEGHQGQPEPQGHPEPQGQSKPQGHQSPQGQPKPQGHQSPQGQPKPQGLQTPQGHPESLGHADKDAENRMQSGELGDRRNKSISPTGDMGQKGPIVGGAQVKQEPKDVDCSPNSMGRLSSSNSTGHTYSPSSLPFPDHSRESKQLIRDTPPAKRPRYDSRTSQSEAQERIDSYSPHEYKEVFTESQVSMDHTHPKPRTHSNESAESPEYSHPHPKPRIRSYESGDFSTEYIHSLSKQRNHSSESGESTDYSHPHPKQRNYSHKSCVTTEYSHPKQRNYSHESGESSAYSHSHPKQRNYSHESGVTTEYSNPKQRNYSHESGESSAYSHSLPKQRNYSHESGVVPDYSPSDNRSHSNESAQSAEHPHKNPTHESHGCMENSYYKYKQQTIENREGVGYPPNLDIAEYSRHQHSRQSHEGQENLEHTRLKRTRTWSETSQAAPDQLFYDSPGHWPSPVYPAQVVAPSRMTPPVHPVVMQNHSSQGPAGGFAEVIPTPMHSHPLHHPPAGSDHTIRGLTEAVGIQCVLPVLPPTEQAVDYSKRHLTDTGTQCELLMPPTPTDPEYREEQPSSASGGVEGVPKIVVPKCDHCGISFEDDVLYSIHMGCHSHRDPYLCNICGKQCSNRYSFYTHIMRGHNN